ncbi:MAG: hypothetical protein ACRDTA_03925 [Pseudonocardiaceae bacterium]
MRIVACGLIVGAAVLGAAPVAMADEPVGKSTSIGSESQAAPQAEVSMLAVSLTVGGTIAMAGSGVALARRRAVSPSS